MVVYYLFANLTVKCYTFAARLIIPKHLKIWKLMSYLCDRTCVIHVKNGVSEVNRPVIATVQSIHRTTDETSATTFNST